MSRALRTKIGRWSAQWMNHLVARPSGFYPTLAALSADPATGAEAVEVAPAYQADEGYINLFGREALDYVVREAQHEGVATRVASVPGGRIVSDFGSNVAVFSRNRRLIGELSFQFGQFPDGRFGNLPPAHNAFATGVPAARLRRAPGTVFSLLCGGAAYTYFYHWFLDVLPRLEALRRSGWHDEVDAFLFPSVRQRFQRESLELLGIPPEQVLDGNHWHHLRADRLIATSHPRSTTYHVQPWVTDYLRQSFDPERLGLALTPELCKPLIYISRGDARYRRVVNEREVMACLAPVGFEAVELTRYSLRQAIVLFRQARCIVAPHGAGLTNLLFCAPGTKVLELFSAHHLNPYFYSIARNLGLDYGFQRGLPTDDEQVTSRFVGSKKDIRVDIDALRAQVRGMLND